MYSAPGPATLAPTALIDSDHPAVVEFSRRATGATARERAISLYYLVRGTNACGTGPWGTDSRGNARPTCP